MIERFLLGESREIEYKQSYSKTILKTVSAFANYSDGTILIGISDEGQVVGVDHPAELKLSLENAIHDGIDPLPLFEIDQMEHQGKEIILLKIYKGEFTPYLFQRKAYRRLDTSTVEVDRYDLEDLILHGRNTSFEEQESPENELEFQYLSGKLKHALGLRNISDDTMITLGLKNRNRFNHAAALLSDSNPVVGAVVQLIAYQNGSISEIKDRQTLSRMSVLQQFDRCIDFYHKHVNVGETITGPYRETLEEIPLVAYREAIANMIVHRDYSRQIESRVEIYSDRIEILSPGGLPMGISEDEYIHGRISVARNRILADLFLRLKIIEKLATGVRRIKSYYQDSETKPEFLVAPNSILVILPNIRTMQLDNNTLRDGNLELLNDKEREIYHLIRENAPIDRSSIEKQIGLGKSQTIELLNHLRNKKLIAQIGRGRSVKYMIYQ